ncbi:hypothetical protein BC830DRAFT_529833 [Chytriomyces sp. MP71]|nr:hypothetical protein BC830DRAFT_529833 [Chytriomyces sp. MP71]
MATDCYVPYSAEVVRAHNNPSKDKETEDREKGLHEWRTKNELMMSAAHVGTATKGDLPFDTRHFPMFTSTNEDTYKAPCNVEPLVRFDKKPKGATHIPQGDRDKQNSYSTESTTSFVPHSVAASKERVRGFHTQATNKSLLGKSGDPNIFQTTSQWIYQKPSDSGFSDINISVIKGKERGRSNIAFGEHFEVPRLNFLSNEKKKESVTHRDYSLKNTVLHKDEEEGSHLKWHKNFTTVETEGYKTGMAGAIRPDSRSQQYLSCAAQDFIAGPIDTRNQLITASSREATYRSSIPTGDDKRFSYNGSATTTSASYKAYPDMKMPTFPVLGEKITKSEFTFGDADMDLVASTSAASYVDHGRRFKNVAKNHRGFGLDLLKATNVDYGMGENATTNNAVYRDPSSHARTKAYEPKTVHSTRLFPLESHLPDRQYETTNQRFHNMRDGLIKVTRPGEIKGRSASSIVFGDKLHFTTHGDPIFS